MYGSSITEDGLGKPIIAMTSQTTKGESKITAFLKQVSPLLRCLIEWTNLIQGAGVVTTRAHAHYVVTEYGIAQLWSRNIRQRAYSLIQIAHPNHRESLEKAAFERFKFIPSPN
jgi:acyl-CoA hydrolase